MKGAHAIAICLLTTTASCTDPVRDREIEALGDEAPGVSPGPEHRPGQPCVVCHSDGGPASGKPFAVAGTVYSSPTGFEGARDIEVRFVDAANGAPTVPVFTNAVGNFFVRESEWPDLRYPFKVALFRNNTVAAQMATTVNREGSCNFCHRNPADFGDNASEAARRYYGQIFVGN
jgi:hypothetical protein